MRQVIKHREIKLLYLYDNKMRVISTVKYGYEYI